MLANSDYLNCHNQIASQIHSALCGKYGLFREIRTMVATQGGNSFGK